MVPKPALKTGRRPQIDGGVGFLEKGDAQCLIHMPALAKQILSYKNAWQLCLSFARPTRSSVQCSIHIWATSAFPKEPD
jgi:hypothetical protein